MTKPFTRRPYQDLMREHLFEHKRAGLWAGMGLGKTVVMESFVQELQLVESRPALALAPLRVAQSTWPDEARKWDHLQGMEISPVVGTPAERIAALKRNVPLYTMNYDNLPWLIDYFGKRWPFSTVIADESTRLKNFRGAYLTHPKTGKLYYRGDGGQRARALGRVAHVLCDRFIELTGTPSPNGLQDLWGQLWFLDAGRRLGRTYGSFTERWFQADESGHGIKPLPHAQDEIQSRVRDICLAIKAKDWFDLKDPIVTNVYVDLPAKARAIYRDMEKEMFAMVESRGVEAVHAAGRDSKLMQLANGAIYLDPEVDGDDHPKAKEWKEVHDAKIQALDSIVAEAGGAPILVAYKFKSDLARLRAAFPAGRTLDSNPNTIQAWNAGRIPLLFAHPQSAGHGLNLQDGGNILVFFGHDWNLEEWEQIIERIGPTRQAQAGHDRNVFIYNIIARQTIDSLVMARRDSKRSVQDLLMEAAKRGHCE